MNRPAMNEDPVRRKKELAKIHVLKTQAGLDDELYREMLFSVTGKRSAALLDAWERKKVCAFLEGKQSSSPRWFSTMDDPVRGKMFRKLWAMLKSADRQAEYADAIAARMFKVAKVEWLTFDQLRALISSMEYDRRRRQKTA